MELMEILAGQRSVSEGEIQVSGSPFHATRDEAVEEARSIWGAINGPNLHDNIAPTRNRVDLVLQKDVAHGVAEVWLRKT